MSVLKTQESRSLELDRNDSTCKESESDVDHTGNPEVSKAWAKSNTRSAAPAV